MEIIRSMIGLNSTPPRLIPIDAILMASPRFLTNQEVSRVEIGRAVEPVRETPLIKKGSG